MTIRYILLFIVTSFFCCCYSMSLSRFSLKQSMNLPAIRQSLLLFQKPGLALPHIELDSLNELDTEYLKKKGIKYLVFDKDQTLSDTYCDHFHPSVINIINKLKADDTFSIAILSNSVGSNDDRNYEGAKKTEEMMKIPVIRHKYKKPACISEVITHFESTRSMKVSQNEICMIGDRVLTDIVFGTQHGILSILIKPLNIYSDHPVAVLLRVLERRVLLPLLKLFGVKAAST